MRTAEAIPTNRTPYAPVECRPAYFRFTKMQRIAGIGIGQISYFEPYKYFCTYGTSLLSTIFALFAYKSSIGFHMSLYLRPKKLKCWD